MTCNRCGKKIAASARKCPYCGEPREDAGSGVFQSSTVLISADGADLVYRSMEEVPGPLRNRLLKSTNSANSATILIADRRGRREIAKVMRHLPGSGQRRLVQSLMDPANVSENPRLGPLWKKVTGGVVAALTLLLIAFVFLHRW